jgi:hypothetical protein
MKHRFLSTTCLVLALGVPATLPAQPKDAIRSTQDVLTEWISVEKTLSADRTQWALEREVLTSANAFMAEEIARLEQIIQDAEETASAGERKRAELEEARARLDAVNARMEGIIGTFEARLLEQSKSWPSAFLAMVRVPLSRIPDGTAAQRPPLTMRLQNVVAVLSQFDKFNSVVTKDLAVQEIEGTPREVTTLYYGFAFAYFVDGTGSHAGYGHPNPAGEGWTWISEPGLASSIQDLVGVFEQTREAVFLALPAKIATP